MTQKDQLRDIWATVLELEDFDNAENIMDLGGDSLKIYQISAMSYEKYGLKFAPIDVMMYPNINALSDFIQNKNENSEIIKAVKTVKKREVRR